MAEFKDKLPDNARGKFYVDGQCIDCDVCRDTSPDNFARSDENGYSFVVKQPETTEEFKLCEEAMEACPVEAIGDDGVRGLAANSMTSVVTAY
jgi:ferredoxin